MKKGLLGCLIVGLVLLLLGAASAYWFIVKPLVSAGGSIIESSRQWAQVAEAEKALKNRDTYDAPADGRLTPAQVAAFVQVQTRMHAQVGKELEALAEDYEDDDGKVNPEHADMSLGEAMSSFGDLGAMMLKAKQTQIAALNDADLSMDEYRWIRTQVYVALPWVLGADEADAAAATDAEVALDPNRKLPPVEEGGEIAKIEPAAEAPAVAAEAPAVEVEVDAGTDTVELPAEADESESVEVAAAKANAGLLRPHRALLEKAQTSLWLDL